MRLLDLASMLRIVCDEVVVELLLLLSTIIILKQVLHHYMKLLRQDIQLKWNLECVVYQKLLMNNGSAVKIAIKRTQKTFKSYSLKLKRYLWQRALLFVKTLLAYSHYSHVSLGFNAIFHKAMNRSAYT